MVPDSLLEQAASADDVLLHRASDKLVLCQIDGLWVHQGTSTVIADADWSNIV
jgi:hypothetical protein